MSFIAQCFTSLVKEDHFITLVRLLLLQPCALRRAAVAVAIVTATAEAAGARGKEPGRGVVTSKVFLVDSWKMSIPRSARLRLRGPLPTAPSISLSLAFEDPQSFAAPAIPQITQHTNCDPRGGWRSSARLLSGKVPLSALPPSVPLHFWKVRQGPGRLPARSQPWLSTFWASGEPREPGLARRSWRGSRRQCASWPLAPWELGLSNGQPSPFLKRPLSPPASPNAEFAAASERPHGVVWNGHSQREGWALDLRWPRRVSSWPEDPASGLCAIAPEKRGLEPSSHA